MSVSSNNNGLGNGLFIHNDQPHMGNTNIEGDLQVSGDLTVAGAIRPGTFTNRVVQFVDVGGAGTMATLTAADSGSVFLVPALTAGAQIVNLPASNANLAGVNYTFLVQVATGAGTLQITPNAAAGNTIEGQVCTGANTTTAHASGSANVSIAATALPGMQMTVRYKGTGSAATDVWDVQTGSYSAAFVA